MPDREDDLLASRQAKLERLRQQGIEPYPPRLKRTCDAASAIARFEAVERGDAPESDAQDLSVAGRIVSVRTMGRAAFLDLRDASGVVQALLRQNVLGEEFELLKNLDVGDHLGVDGPMIRTRTGQISIEAHRLTLAAKGMRPLPGKVARSPGRGDPVPPEVLGLDLQSGRDVSFRSTQPGNQHHT